MREDQQQCHFSRLLVYSDLTKLQNIFWRNLLNYLLLFLFQWRSRSILWAVLIFHFGAEIIRNNGILTRFLRKKFGSRYSGGAVFSTLSIPSDARLYFLLFFFKIWKVNLLTFFSLDFFVILYTYLE